MLMVHNAVFTCNYSPFFSLRSACLSYFFKRPLPASTIVLHRKLHGLAARRGGEGGTTPLQRNFYFCDACFLICTLFKCLLVCREVQAPNDPRLTLQSPHCHATPRDDPKVTTNPHHYYERLTLERHGHHNQTPL